MARQFQAGADVQGSVRGRIGIAFDRFLIYGTGGVAFTGFNTTITDTTGFFTGVQGTNTTFSNTRAGWTAGGGIDRKCAILQGCEGSEILI